MVRVSAGLQIDALFFLSVSRFHYPLILRSPFSNRHKPWAIAEGLLG